MRIGYHCLSVPDKAALAAHLVKIQARGVLFYQHELDFARTIKTALPDCHVIIRSFPDMDIDNVDRWIDTHEPLSAGGLIVQTTNEPGWSQETADKHLRLLARIKERKSGMKIGILALATGNPIDVQSWYYGDALFRMVATMRDQVYLLLHSYFGGVVTSGIVGSDPRDTRYHPDYVPMENWPADTSQLTLFHVGRERFLLNYLKSKSIPAPKIILSEFGADFLGDIGKWLASLTSDSARANYPDTVDGWRELWSQWRAWYPNLTAEEVYVKMCAYADAHMISPEVEAVLIYGWGIDPNWLKYRVDDTRFPEKLEAYIELTQQPPVPAPAPVPVPPPIPAPIPTPPPPVIEYVLKLTAAEAARLATLADKAAGMSNWSAELETEAARVKSLALDISAEIKSILEMAIQRSKAA